MSRLGLWTRDGLPNCMPILFYLWCDNEFMGTSELSALSCSHELENILFWRGWDMPPRSRLLVRYGSKPILVAGNFLGGLANVLNGFCWYARCLDCTDTDSEPCRCRGWGQYRQSSKHMWAGVGSIKRILTYNLQHTDIHTYIHTYIRTYVRTYIHTYIYII